MVYAICHPRFFAAVMLEKEINEKEKDGAETAQKVIHIISLGAGR